MLVLTKDFEHGEYGVVQEHFERHWTAIGGIQGMMMISQTISPLKQRIYLILPNNNSTPYYSEFREIPENELPEKAGLLVGYNDDFTKRFRFEYEE